jgi:hypothetical protein
MALTDTEEALLRDLLEKRAELIALANNETTITAKLGSTKATIDDLTAATTVADADLMIVRQGGVDKKLSVSVVKSDLVDLSSYAPKASPALTGTPTAPTATAGTSTTQLATTEFVQTATGGLLTDPAITGCIKEDVYTITDGAAFEIDPGNGSVQIVTLGANRTPKATNFAAGESITLMVLDGTAYTITWTDATFGGSGVVWVGGSAPTLDVTKYTVIQLWKVGTQVYGVCPGAA